MTGLDCSATIRVTAVGVWAALGMMPGKIARQRNHPQADAVAVAGWWGVITMGLLLPLAFIWAYYRSSDNQASDDQIPVTAEQEEQNA